MREYIVRHLDYFDTLEDVKRFLNFFILMGGSGVTVYGEGDDNPSSKFIQQNPDMFMFKPVEPDNIPSSGRWLLQDVVELGTAQIVWRNIKRLFR